MNTIAIYKSYLSKELPATLKHREQILEQILDSLKEYMVYHPNSSYEQIVEGFGDPHEIANSYLTIQFSEEFLCQKRKIKKIALVVIITLILLTVGGVFCYYNIVPKYKIVETPAEELTSSEFNAYDWNN